MGVYQLYVTGSSTTVLCCGQCDLGQNIPSQAVFFSVKVRAESPGDQAAFPVPPKVLFSERRCNGQIRPADDSPEACPGSVRAWEPQLQSQAGPLQPEPVVSCAFLGTQLSGGSRASFMSMPPTLRRALGLVSCPAAWSLTNC